MGWLVLLAWGDTALDRLLITKVRSDLAVARGYFDQVRAEVGGGTESVAGSHALLRALQAGAKDFISKPFDLVEVKTRIHNMLEVRLLYRKLKDYNQVLEARVQERTAELRESEARFRRLTELSSDWYWEQDAQHRFTRISKGVMEITGRDESSFIGKTRCEAFGGDRLDNIIRSSSAHGVDCRFVQAQQGVETA